MNRQELFMKLFVINALLNELWEETLDKPAEAIWIDFAYICEAWDRYLDRHNLDELFEDLKEGKTV